MNAEKMNERVLVMPEHRFRSLGLFHGFRSYCADYLAGLLEPGFLSYRPRREVETNPSYKQLIPYIVLRCRGNTFHYTRGSSATEKRLHALRSIGIGGHISFEDGQPANDPYRVGMLRELHEEIAIDSPFSERCLGFIYDGTSAVSEVHLGIVHLLELEKPIASPRESAIVDSGFAPLGELIENREQFETWSQFVLQELL